MQQSKQFRTLDQNVILMTIRPGWGGIYSRSTIQLRTAFAPRRFAVARPSSGERPEARRAKGGNVYGLRSWKPPSQTTARPRF